MIKIIYIFQEDNKIVDGLALMALSRLVGRYFFMQLIDEVLLLLHDDCSEIV